MDNGPLERVLSRLPHYQQRPLGGWSAKCPAHNGQGDTSLSIDEGDDGRVSLLALPPARSARS
jgi:hypothetical protein